MITFKNIRAAIHAASVATTGIASLLAGLPALAQQPGAGAVDLRNVLIVQEFVGTGDISQCNESAYGQIVSAATNWSPPIKIDTDGRLGGCQYRIGIIDPDRTLRGSGFGLTMLFIADGDPAQCGGQGPHPVPISDSLDSVEMTLPIVMDMDDRVGGCVQRWSVTGSRVSFDLTFYGDGDIGQCGNVGTQSAPPDISIKLDTDSRPGGCLQTLRLR